MTDQIETPDGDEADHQHFRSEPVPVIPIEVFHGHRDLWVAANLVHFHEHLVEGTCSNPLDHFPVGLGSAVIDLATQLQKYGLALAKSFGEAASTADIKEVGTLAVTNGYGPGIAFALAAGFAHDFTGEDTHDHDAEDIHDHLRADDDGFAPPRRPRRSVH